MTKSDKFKIRMGTSMTSLGESASALAMWISVVLLVIFSIAHMKMSEMIEMPRKLEKYVSTETVDLLLY